MRKISTWLVITLEGEPEASHHRNPPYVDEATGDEPGRAVAAGDGFLLGRVTREEWAVVTEGQPAADPRVGEHHCRDAGAGSAAGPHEKPTARVSGLVQHMTERELEVLRLVAAGRRNHEIAKELVVTLDTVKKHVSHIHAKLGAASRTEAVAHARRLGLID